MHEIDLMLKYQLEGKHKEARELSDKLERIGPQEIKDPMGKNTQDIWFRHCFNRGWFLLQEGRYQEGCQLLEHGRYLNVYGNPPLQTTAPIYNPEKDDIKGKSIIISLEGGFGDEIIHARFAKKFKELGADKVYLAAAPELVGVFSRIEGVDKVILRNQSNTVQHDFWIPGFSSGWTSGCDFDTIPNEPYLFALDESTEIWKSIVNSEKVKVGIRWAGNPKFEHQQFRRFPEEFITNISKYEELQVYSLQRDNNLIELPDNIIDLQHFLISWEDTMAAIANMDIVISSCTSVAHLAAAMGKETWIIVPILPYHTWTLGSPESTTSPYYKTVKLFRQETKSKWNEAFQLLYSALEEKFNLKHIEHPNVDREVKKINLGCGMKKIEGYINVDISEKVKPDQVVDLNTYPWPWKDNEIDHIVAKDILEHLGDKNEDIIDVIKEMYRISNNGAVWEIQFPHWRCDTALADPTHKRSMTTQTFELFDKKTCLERVKKGFSDSILAFEEDVDIEICDVQFDYTAPFDMRIKQGQMKSDELIFSLNHFNNVALSVRLLIQVHKPGRVSLEDVDKMIV